MPSIGEALAQLYRSPAGQDATYRPTAGGAVAVRAILSVEPAGASWNATGTPDDQPIVSLRVAEVAEPKAGDEIDLADGTTWRVRSARRRPGGDEWRCEVEEVV